MAYRLLVTMPEDLKNKFQKACKGRTMGLVMRILIKKFADGKVRISDAEFTEGVK